MCIRMPHICGNIKRKSSKLEHNNKNILWQANFKQKVPKQAFRT